MNWLQDLLTNPDSIAHIVALYSFVIAAGVLLGKIKVFGISLGVTFVLFVGTKKLVKRREFEEYISQNLVI